MPDRSERSSGAEPEVLAALGMVLVVVLLAWAMPVGAAWTFDGTIPPMVDSVAGSARVMTQHRWSEPAAAYPGDLKRHMPAGPAWWLGAGLGFGVVAATGVGAWRRVDVLVARSTLGRRPYDLRGARPRAWARPRDAAELASSRRRPGRFTLGTLDGRLLLSDAEAHIAVVAPTRAGKTTRCVIPWLLEHDGPAIVTSTKTDVLHATEHWRARLGRVAVWDPFGSRSDAWTPLAGCDDWSFALRQAQWLADAAKEGDSEIASYWRGEAARLLAPLLHAAAVGERTMTDVLAWVDGQDVKRPVAALRAGGDPAAIRQLSGILELDPRNRGNIYMSAGSVVASYRFPEVQAHSGSGLTPAEFFDGNANTLYIVASSRQQASLAPLVVGLISSLLHAAAERSNAGETLDRTLRVLLDEAANIAPLRDLPAHLSQAAGHGIRMATMWQSIGQMHHRYGDAADDILANSTVKMFMGPISDDRTRRSVQGMLGDDPGASPRGTGKSRRGSRTAASPMADAASLRQLLPDRALVVEGRTAAAIVRIKPWWKDGALRARGRPRGAAAESRAMDRS